MIFFIFGVFLTGSMDVEPYRDFLVIRQTLCAAKPVR